MTTRLDLLDVDSNYMVPPCTYIGYNSNNNNDAIAGTRR